MVKKRVFILVLCALLMMVSVPAFAADGTSLVRFLPIRLTVSENQVVMDGYFVNMYTDRKTVQIQDLKLEIYQSGKLLITTGFSDPVACAAEPQGMIALSFVMNGSHNLINGVYDCDASFYCVMSGSLTVEASTTETVPDGSAN